MPLIDYLSSSGDYVEFSGANTSNTNSWSNTCPGASGFQRRAYVVSNLVAGAGAGIPVTNVSATYGGQAMTRLSGSTRYGPSGNDYNFCVFAIANYPTGTQTVSVTATGMPFSFALRQHTCAVITYQDATFIDTGGQTLYSASQSNNFTVTASNLTAGDMALFFHVRGASGGFTTYTQGGSNATARFTLGGSAYSRVLIADDTAVDGSVASAVTSATDWQAAMALRIRRLGNQEFFMA